MPKGRTPKLNPVARNFHERYRTDAEVAQLKQSVINLYDKGRARTLSEAADALKLSKVMLFGWRKLDPVWASLLDEVEGVFADELEAQLLDVELKMPQIIARMFLLKKIRPRYRDTYRDGGGTSPEFTELMEGIRDLARSESNKTKSATAIEKELRKELEAPENT